MLVRHLWLPLLATASNSFRCVCCFQCEAVQSPFFGRAAPQTRTKWIYSVFGSGGQQFYRQKICYLVVVNIEKNLHYSVSTYVNFKGNCCEKSEIRKARLAVPIIFATPQSLSNAHPALSSSKIFSMALRSDYSDRPSMLFAMCRPQTVCALKPDGSIDRPPYYRLLFYCLG